MSLAQAGADIQAVEKDVQEVQKVVAEAQPVIADVEKEAAVIAPLGQRLIADLENAVEFVIHCFKCKNKPGTSTPLVKDSIKIAKPANANAQQVSGVCAKCRSNVKGFVSSQVAHAYSTSTGVTIPAPAQSAPVPAAAAAPESKQ